MMLQNGMYGNFAGQGGMMGGGYGHDGGYGGWGMGGNGGMMGGMQQNGDYGSNTGYHLRGGGYSSSSHRGGHFNQMHHQQFPNTHMHANAPHQQNRFHGHGQPYSQRGRGQGFDHGRGAFTGRNQYQQAPVAHNVEQRRDVEVAADVSEKVSSEQRDTEPVTAGYAESPSTDRPAEVASRSSENANVAIADDMTTTDTVIRTDQEHGPVVEEKEHAVTSDDLARQPVDSPPSPQTIRPIEVLDLSGESRPSTDHATAHALYARHSLEGMPAVATPIGPVVRPTIAPHERGLGVIGAPTGPKAMREGGPNTGFRGRGGFPARGASRALTQSATHQAPSAVPRLVFDIDS